MHDQILFTSGVRAERRAELEAHWAATPAPGFSLLVREGTILVLSNEKVMVQSYHTGGVLEGEGVL